MTTIYQITDTHVGLEDDNVARKNFLVLMDYVSQNPVDFLLITGDLPNVDGSTEIYAWMKSKIPAAQKTYVIPGNHDYSDNLFQVFGEEICGNKDFVFTIQLESIDLVFTNTGSTNFPESQLAYLQRPEVREHSVLFTHFPTKKISDGFMDRNYPLQNIDATDKAIRASNIDHVFCGHFHTEFMVEDGYKLNVTPSPAFEVELHAIKAKITSPRIPIREINIQGTTTTSSVIYL
ncbi:MAG: metallophosphoesterase [Pseudomonadales bacterium]|jgi:DNA repair exonuclease SbcCD nuclease subunit